DLADWLAAVDESIIDSVWVAAFLKSITACSQQGFIDPPRIAIALSVVRDRIVGYSRSDGSWRPSEKVRVKQRESLTREAHLEKLTRLLPEVGDEIGFDTMMPSNVSRRSYHRRKLLIDVI